MTWKKSPPKTQHQGQEKTRSSHGVQTSTWTLKVNRKKRKTKGHAARAACPSNYVEQQSKL
jgi:hypothetical protein